MQVEQFGFLNSAVECNVVYDSCSNSDHKNEYCDCNVSVPSLTKPTEGCVGPKFLLESCQRYYRLLLTGGLNNRVHFDDGYHSNHHIPPQENYTHYLIPMKMIYTSISDSG